MSNSMVVNAFELPDRWHFWCFGPQKFGLVLDADETSPRAWCSSRQEERSEKLSQGPGPGAYYGPGPIRRARRKSRDDFQIKDFQQNLCRTWAQGR